MDGRGMLQMFLTSLPQGPDCLSYVFLITCYIVTLVDVDDSTLLILGVLVLGLHEYLFNRCGSFEMYLDAILTTDVFETFGCPLSVWNDHLSYSVGRSWVCIGCACILIVVDLWLTVVVCDVLIICLVPPSCY